ncbi:hypothetical protein QL992_05955 [Microbacterium sp. APC 3898]|uniref:DUF4352 domain-containing protein n=1 Tax=Planococcus notacanthi TaxID=3035188 RepID=A0ABT7ZNZ7_9BACL|nr:MULTISPECIES: hypothetical protein [Terrabacteria group]MDN3428548.1 hypothetical protein [Planococcus sp. APC 4016]MDN3498744.1 hypothetical protein [Microbacterium sp. APC 3898]
MIKKWFIPIIISSVVLAGCGSDTAEVNEESENTTTASEETSANTEESESTEETEEVEEAVEVDEDVQEDDSMKATNTYTNKELGITGEIGPMKYEIPGIQLKIIEPKDQATADLFEVAVGDEVHAFTIQFAGENTSEEDMSFYLDQAVAITNTKEQLDPDMLLSEYIDGEYLGQVRHEGHNVYILKNSTVDELKSIELRIMAPYDTNFETVGEDVSHTIEVNK